MCFAPQRPVLFRHLSFQKCSELVNSLHFRNVLRATTACTFLTLKRASRHNGVQFFISHLPSGLRTRRFSEPTFRPSGATNHWKNTMFRDFPTFSRTWIFFLLRLSLFWSSSSLLFADSSHLCFSSVHIVGSLTSKLPSMTLYHIISHQQADSNFFFAPSWLFLCLRGLISCCAYICFLERALVLKR